MAAKLEGGAYLSSFVDAVLEKLSAILEDDDFVLEGNDSALELLQKIEKSLYDVGPVLDDAELKQFSDKKVKKWLIDLQDALYKADDLLDELSTKAATATQRDPGNSSPWSHYVDSCIEDSGINVIGKTVATLESVKRRKGYLRLFPKESAKMDISSWRIPSTSLVVSSDIFEDEDSIKLFQEANNRAVHMRTFLYFSFLHHPKSIDIESDPCLLRQQLGCLRVLSFERLLLASLLDSIGELIHLRYLNLSDTPIVTLPESICKLYNLQTLKLKNCAQLEMLPSSMQDLVNLRHLDIRGASHLKAMPKEISKLKHINFLSDYIVGEHEGNGIRELGTLDNLHGSFCISKLENVKNSGEVLEAKMGKKKHINTLELNWLPDGDIDDLQTERDILDKLQPHENLKELSIELHLYDCPEIDCFADEGLPPSLKKLQLTECHKLASWIASKGLQSEGLTHLELCRCSDVKSFPGEGCLPASLEFLELWKLPNLETLDCKGLHHLTSLKNLRIRYCDYLNNIREEHLLASIENIFIGNECPLTRKLKEMEDLRIEFARYYMDSDYSDDDYWYD
ncbi:hypothetical protein Ahy_B09g095041 isoform C [Arachis hypogaea]|uniref:Uncharacterized protein n=1 Tax=Arachis hypogaea TaxID=3818 RepID=A0A444XCR4_ARAHY|nr:hypothetical protein Ahy_B09g095041 isoform C [Arachis hypogaea]